VKHQWGPINKSQQLGQTILPAVVAAAGNCTSPIRGTFSKVSEAVCMNPVAQTKQPIQKPKLKAQGACNLTTAALTPI